MLSSVLSRVAIGVALTGVLLGTSVSSTPAAHAAVPTPSQQSQAQALEAQISTLQNQLIKVLASSSNDAQGIVQVEQELAQTQGQLAAAQITLDGVNEKLAITNKKLAEVTRKAKQDRAELAAVVTKSYETQSGGSGIAQILGAHTFPEAMNNLDGIQHVASGMQVLTTEVNNDLKEIQKLQAEQLSEQKQAQSVVDQLAQLSSQETAQDNQYKQEASQLSGQAAALNAQIEGLAGQVLNILGVQEGSAALAAAAAAGSATVIGAGLPPFSFGPLPDYFPWGQCTWYAASEHLVTWSGNAADWATNAKAQGAKEGPLPMVGAIVVWGAGGGYSAEGHVAYVTAVQGPAQFTVSESNYQGLGVVDSRQVNTLNDVEAFIY